MEKYFLLGTDFHQKSAAVAIPKKWVLFSYIFVTLSKVLVGLVWFPWFGIYISTILTFYEMK
jgi:hypothetical protein